MSGLLALKHKISLRRSSYCHSGFKIMAYRVLICSCWLVAVLIIMLSLFRRNEMNVGSMFLPCCYFLEAIYKQTTYLVREDP